MCWTLHHTSYSTTLLLLLLLLLLLSVAALHHTQHHTSHISSNATVATIPKIIILLTYVQWNIQFHWTYTPNTSLYCSTVSVHTYSGAAVACVIVHNIIIVQHTTLLYTATVSRYSKYSIMYVEQIGKRGISFSGSQYGSCSTIYNTLPVTKVVYNWFRAPASQ